LRQATDWRNHNTVQMKNSIAWKDKWNAVCRIVANSDSVSGKAVTDALFGLEILRLCGIVFNFSTQTRHENAQVMRVLGALWSPDFGEQMTVSQNFAGVADERS